MLDELILFINQNCRNSVVVVYHSLMTLVEFYNRKGELVKSLRYGNSISQKKVLTHDLQFYASNERLALDLLQ